MSAHTILFLMKYPSRWWRMNKAAAAILIVLIFSGCVNQAQNDSESNLPFAMQTPLNAPVTELLSKMGYSSYGLQETIDPAYGELMLLGMRLKQNISVVSRQIDAGFKLMYNKNPSKDFYLMELSDEVGVVFVGSRGSDIRAYASGEISEAEWNRLNNITMSEFYARINRILPPDAGQAFLF